MPIKRKSDNHIRLLIIIIVSAIAGFIIAKFVQFRFFQIDDKINLVDIASIIVTVLFGVYISMFFEKEKEINKTEKELIINRIGDIFTIINETKTQVLANRVVYQVATSSVKRISISMLNIFNILRDLGLKYDIEMSNQIVDDIKSLRNVLTNSSLVDEQNISNAPAQVRESIIHFNNARISEIETTFEKLKNSIFTFQLTINRL